MMDAIGFCVIGTGRAGLIHARNIAGRVRGARLVALCDANEDALRDAGDELGVETRVTDYREAVALPAADAVVIVTPTFSHCDITCAAAGQGKHVFLEKPMAITVEECRRMGDAAKKAAVKLQVGFMRRFHDEFRTAKGVLESGRMGRVMTVKSVGRGPGLPAPWMYDIGKSNGILAEVNSHDFDSVRWLAGSDITRVHAEAGNFKCPEAKADYPDFYDNAVVALRFDNGAVGTIDGTCPCHYGYDARMEILCENGMLCIGSARDRGLTEVTRDGNVIGRTVTSWRGLFREAYVSEMEHFVDCVTRDREPAVTGEDGLKAVQAVVAANESIRRRTPVEVAGMR
jgi:myo-inositol 2-dehydrogenase/D-chiro-inositol 1-dehydrogenase/scyllo-inositol 2-dehydrogenase (NAD+)